MAAAAESGTSLATDVLPLVFSTLAIGISIWGTAIAARDSRRSRPRVSVHALYTDKMATGPGPSFGTAVLLTVSNTGTEPTQIGGLWFQTPGMTFALNGANAISDGPPLPFVLAGHSSQTWAIDASAAPDEADVLIMSLSLGHGEDVRRTLVKNRLLDGELRRPRGRLGRRGANRHH